MSERSFIVFAFPNEDVMRAALESLRSSLSSLLSLWTLGMDGVAIGPREHVLELVVGEELPDNVMDRLPRVNPVPS